MKVRPKYVVQEQWIMLGWIWAASRVVDTAQEQIRTGQVVVWA
jgi:hypothetical protein